MENQTTQNPYVPPTQPVQPPPPVKESPLRPPSGLVKKLAIGMGIVLVVGAIGAGGYLSLNKNAPEPVAQPIPTLTPTPTPDPTSNWKTYENNKFSIMYPPNWIVDDPAQFYEADVVFKSSNYAESAAPHPLKGFKVYLYINSESAVYSPLELGSPSSESQTWLGRKATLTKSFYESATVTLWTNDNANLRISMYTPPFEKPMFKTFEDNRDDFMTVANSLKLKSDSNVGTGCKITGCSGQICSDEDVVTTCEYKAEYACYKTARCEKQANGKCGWTPTEELSSCLNSN